MGDSYNVEAWSKTASSNDGIDSGIGTVADTSLATAVDGWTRGVMAAMAKFIDDISGAPSSVGGTANAHTVTTNRAISSAHLTDGFHVTYAAPAANTSTTVTLAVDSLTAKNIKRSDGSALTVGCITSGMMLDLVYKNSTSEFWALNLPPLKVAFSAYRGSSQSISTDAATKVTFNTEEFDDGACYDSSTNYRWTPPAGKYCISAALLISGATSTSGNFTAKLYKNGSTANKTIDERVTNGTNTITLLGTVIVEANGTDYFEIFVSNDVSDTSYTINAYSRFQGFAI